MVPPATKGVAVLARPRLLELMRGRFEVGVVALVAGAGFGKTTLLRQALADNVASPRGIDVSLTCGPADARATHLARRLADAVDLDIGLADSEPTLGALCGALAENAAIPTCIVLDDMHHVPPDSPGGRLLRDLLALAPENAHFVVASRESVPGLARRRVQRQVVEIAEPDLRFTGDELATIGGPSASRAPIDLGGWPALVSLAMTFGPNAAREFAREEVLDALDPVRRRGLAALAAISGGDRVLSADVLASIVGDDIDLDDLIAGLPLVLADETSVIPHALWSDLLAGVLTDAERHAINVHAAAHYRAVGDGARGFDLSVAVDDLEGVRALIRDSCSRGYAAVPRDVLADWQARLPDALRDEPEGLLLAGIAERARDPFGAGARDLLDRARLGFQARGDVAAEIATSSEYVFVLRARGELDQVGPVVERAFALEAAGNEVARGTSQLARGLIAEALGDDVGALAELGRIDPGAISPEWQVAADFMTMVTAYSAGLEAETLAAAHRCVAGVGAGYPGHDLIRPGAAWLVGRPNDVPPVLPALPDAGRATPIDLLWAGSVVANIAAARGEVEHAREAHALAASALGDDALPFLRAVVVGAGATVDAVAGDEAAAVACLEKFLGGFAWWDPGVDRGLRTAFVVAYVLAPACREWWDAAPLGPVLQRKRAIARMIVASREGRPLPEREFLADELALVSATPPRWVAELAAALVARDRADEGRELATALGAVCGVRALDALREVEQAVDVDVARGAHRLRARLAIAVGPPITVELLGPTQLSRAGRLVDHEHLRRRRVRELLAFVAHQESTTRDKVLGALWPDLSDAAARRNLRVTLTYLQSVLEPDRLRDEPPFYLSVDQERIRLAGAPHVVLDIRQFEAVVAGAEAATATGDLDAATDEYERALRLWRGDYLEEFRDSEWAGVASDHARAIAVGAFVRAGNVALGAGRTDAALAAAQRTLAVEPWSEDAYRVQIAALLAAGDRAGAARALEQCDAMLAELGVDPAPTTDMLRRSFSGAPR